MEEEREEEEERGERERERRDDLESERDGTEEEVPALVPPPVDFTLINETHDFMSATRPAITPPDGTSPRTTNLMEQFSRVMSSVGDDEDENGLELDGEYDFQRENLFTPPQGERGEKEEENEPVMNQEQNIQVDSIDFDIWEDHFIPPPPQSAIQIPTLVGSLYGEAPPQNSDRSKLFETIPDYREIFNQESRPVELVVSKIPEELVRARRREVEASEAKVRNDLLNAAKTRERDLLWREHQARTRVETLENKSRQRIESEVGKLYEDKKDREDLIGRQFRRAKEDMEAFLTKQEAYLEEVHGDVAPGQNLARKYRVEWGKYPQPIEMRIKNLRACKNKLPKGAYVLMLSQYDQLGGNPLIWSKLGGYGIGPQYPATTKPVKHYGRYFDRVLKVDDSVFALCPPKKHLRPSNILVIELFHLASRSNPTDRVVAWTALPIINTHFTVVEGKFRLPMIRGETTTSIRHFKAMEELIANDLNSWLCNIYIEIRHLPRSTLFEGSEGTKSEYEIQFDFMSKLLNLKDEDKRNSDHSDNEADDDFKRAKSYQTKAEVDMTLFDRKLHRRKLTKIGIQSLDKDSHSMNLPQRDSPRMHMLNAKGGGGASGWWSQALANRRGSRIASDVTPIPVVSPLIDQVEKPQSPEVLSSGSDGESEAELEPKQLYERSYAAGDEFFLNEFQKGKLPGVDTLDSAADRRWAAAGIEGGNTLRRHQAEGPRLDSEAICAEKNRIGRLREPTDGWSSPLVDQKQYDEYTMSMAPDPGQQRKLLPQALTKSKLRYLYYEALGEILPTQWGTLDSTIAIIAFIIAFWARMYLHYIMQYLFLQIYKVPVYDFQVRFYEIMFKYMSEAVPVSVEFGVVALGPISNLVVFIIFVSLSVLFYRFGGYLPNSISQFVAAFGIATMFDPLCIFLVDVIKHNYNCSEVDEICKSNYTSHDCHCFVGDFIKMWRRMELDENSGLTGLLVTLMVYLGTMIVTGMVLYEYMVRVHKNARILDIWRRVSAPVEEFFIPHDFEVSSAELTSIIARAKLWRGAKGATRKITVSEYIEKDPYDINFVAVTKHYAIYEHELDGKRTLHRHFLMLPDGAIIEIFDQLSLDFSNQFKSLEKLLGVEPHKGHGPTKAKKSNIFGGLENV